MIQFIFAFDFSANWLLDNFSFLVFDRSEDGRLLLVLDHEGALRGFLILLPLDLIVFFLAGFLIALSLARSESCRVLNDEGARLGVLLAMLLVARAATCSAWGLVVLNDEGARGFDDGGDGRGCFGLDVPSTLIFLEEALFDFLILGIFFCAGSIFIHALSRFLLGALTFLVARLGLPIRAGAGILLCTIDLGDEGVLVILIDAMAAVWWLDLAARGFDGRSHAVCALVGEGILFTGGLGLALGTFLLLFFRRRIGAVLAVSSRSILFIVCRCSFLGEFLLRGRSRPRKFFITAKVAVPLLT
jgi:hypothetical protein